MRLCARVVCVVAGSLGGLSTVVAAADPVFRDETIAAGVASSHFTGRFTNVSDAGGGCDGHLNILDFTCFQGVFADGRD